jgi:hypothetical protein
MLAAVFAIIIDIIALSNLSSDTTMTNLFAFSTI